MAEIATIARPYAEALFKAVDVADAPEMATQMNLLASVAGDGDLQRHADNPNAQADQVFALIIGVLPKSLSASIQNLLRTMIENGRLSVLPEVAQQFQTLVNKRAGVSVAVVHSAFEISPAQVQDVLGALEKRFARKLSAEVVVDPSLIGGIRVVVGDEVLDTSVKARLEQMKVALTA